jgi:hypothetical protein
MRRFPRHLVVVVLSCSITACSSYHKASQSIPTSVPPQDRKVCEIEVRKAAPVSIQPRWLPPLGGGGSSTNGVVLGTVDVPHRVWPTHEAYQRAIERCLTAHDKEARG